MSTLQFHADLDGPCPRRASDQVPSSTEGQVGKVPASGAPRIVSATNLLENFRPIESIVDGLPLGRGALVAITGATGSGKTTLSALLQVALCRKLDFAGRQVTQGSVLVLAGENPDDYTMHLAATIQDLQLKPGDLISGSPSSLWIVPGTFSIADEIANLHRQLVELHAELVAVVVDTSAAFFGGDDENDNVAMRQHASTLRALTGLPGRPTVFVLCHPTKSASNDNMLPRGGGAFIAEIDANLTLSRDGPATVSLHWAGKIRGADFHPIKFELVNVELDGFLDGRGRPISTVAARYVGTASTKQSKDVKRNDDDVLLGAMYLKPNSSMRSLAEHCGWRSTMGKPQASKVERALQRLMTKGLATQDRSHSWILTPKGLEAAKTQI